MTNYDSNCFFPPANVPPPLIADGKPVRQAIDALAVRDVDIKVMNYSEKLIKELTNSSRQIEELNKMRQGNAEGKELMKRYPGKFEMKSIDVVPFFHGNLYDKRTVAVVMISREGVNAPNMKLTREFYDEDSRKFSCIEREFDLLWKGAKKLS